MCGMAFVGDILKETEPLVVSKQNIYAVIKCGYSSLLSMTAFSIMMIGETN